MRRLHMPVLLAVLIAVSACSRAPEVQAMKPGTPVTVTMKDGSIVAGRLVEEKADQVVIDPLAGGEWKTLVRADIASLQRTDAANAQGTPASAATPGNQANAPAPPAPSSATPTPAAPVPAFREVTIPARTVLHVRLVRGIASNTSHVEEPLSASLTRPVMVDEIEAIPAGGLLTGVVTTAKPSGKIKGRAELGFRFSTLAVAGDEYRIRTELVFEEARSTTRKDAEKIGIPAAGGAIIGAIVGGGKGAAIGGAVGGGAGTAVVLGTPGEEVRLPSGALVAVKLLEPVTVRVPLGR